jgi:hypothetical protein
MQFDYRYEVRHLSGKYEPAAELEEEGRTPLGDLVVRWPPVGLVKTSSCGSTALRSVPTARAVRPDLPLAVVAIVLLFALLAPVHCAVVSWVAGAEPGGGVNQPHPAWEWLIMALGYRERLHSG